MTLPRTLSLIGAAMSAAAMSIVPSAPAANAVTPTTMTLYAQGSFLAGQPLELDAQIWCNGKTFCMDSGGNSTITGRSVQFFRVVDGAERPIGVAHTDSAGKAVLAGYRAPGGTQSFRARFTGDVTNGPCVAQAQYPITRGFAKVEITGPGSLAGTGTAALRLTVRGLAPGAATTSGDAPLSQPVHLEWASPARPDVYHHYATASANAAGVATFHVQESESRIWFGVTDTNDIYRGDSSAGLTIVSTPAWVGPRALATAHRGKHYRYVLRVAGGDSVVAFRKVGGHLPRGLRLVKKAAAHALVVRGRVGRAAHGSFRLVVRVTDISGHTATRTYRLRVK